MTATVTNLTCATFTAANGVGLPMEQLSPTAWIAFYPSNDPDIDNFSVRIDFCGDEMNGFTACLPGTEGDPNTFVKISMVYYCVGEPSAGAAFTGMTCSCSPWLFTLTGVSENGTCCFDLDADVTVTITE